MEQDRCLAMPVHYAGEDLYTLLPMDRGGPIPMVSVPQGQVTLTANVHVLPPGFTAGELLVLQQLRTPPERADLLDSLGCSGAAQFTRGEAVTQSDCPLGFDQEADPRQIRHNVAEGDLTIEADGADVFVEVYGVRQGEAPPKVTLSGDANGSLCVHGGAAADAIRDGSGDGDVVRKFLGHGHAIRSGTGSGVAVRARTEKVHGDAVSTYGEARDIVFSPADIIARSHQGQPASGPALS